VIKTDVGVDGASGERKRPRDNDCDKENQIDLGPLFLALQVAFGLLTTRNKTRALPYDELLPVWRTVTAESMRPYVKASTLLQIYEVVPKKYFKMALLKRMEPDGRYVYSYTLHIPKRLTFDAAGITERHKAFQVLSANVPNPPRAVELEIVKVAEKLDREGTGKVFAADMSADGPEDVLSWECSPPVKGDQTVLNATDFATYVASSPTYLRFLAYRRTLEGAEAQYGEGSFGQRKLYMHQETALTHLRAGRSVVVATPTASGKSAVYMIPILEMLLNTLYGTALYLAPTKALGHDQARALKLFLPEPFRDLVATYDGDSTANERQDVLSGKYRVVLTNPDMLHCSVLPRSDRWVSFLGQLRYVVLDEVHTYTGAFGIHASYVFRRLVRVRSFYAGSGAPPLQFVMLSATIAQPFEHAVALTGIRDCVVISESTAARPTKHLLFLRCVKSVYQFVGNVLCDLLAAGLQTLCFMKSRALCEIALQATYKILEARKMTESHKHRIAAYRAGYTGVDRRRLEHALTSGQLAAVFCTTAMELGVDIGRLDAVISVGFPGTIASLWQQFGRCGRTASSPGLGIFVSMPDPLDIALCDDAGALLDKPLRGVALDAQNHIIGGMHLAMANSELPRGCETSPSWTDLFGTVEINAATQTAKPFGLRTISQDAVNVVELGTGHLLESLQGFDLYFRVYTGAVWLHQGKTYVIECLDMSLGTAIARLVAMELPYYTQTRDETTARQMHPKRGMTRSAFPTLGSCEVVLRIYGYHRMSRKTNTAIESHEFTPVELVLPTTCVWFALSGASAKEMGIQDPLLGLHGAMHTVMSLIPLYIDTDAKALGAIAKWDSRTRQYYFLIYDKVAGGSGLPEALYPHVPKVLREALQILLACSCLNGCPKCLFSPSCGCYNRELRKAATVAVLQFIVATRLSPSPAAPTGESMIETPNK